MGWEEELFAYLDDLEGQASALFDAEREPELADRSRAEYQQVTLASRLAASLEREVAVEVLGAGTLTGRLERVGTGWCLLHGAGQDWVVRHDAVVAVHGASERSLPEVAWSPLTRLGVGGALRRLAESGEPCSVHVVDGRRHDGVLERVGSDFVEVSAGEARRQVLVAFAALAAVQSRR